VTISYGWPVKPFDHQHPVRGFFNDPRVLDASHAFHFGVDVSAPDGTAVYAVAPGTVYIEDKGHAVAVLQSNGRSHSYWHVKPVVAHHQRVGLHQLLGHIEPTWGHVHLAEIYRRRFYDPLRPGALTPFTDVGNPTVSKIIFRRGNTNLPPDRVFGVVTICCHAFDTPPIFVPPPWSHMPVTPVQVRFRIVRDGKAVVPWRYGVDMRQFRQPADFNVVFAPETRQNHPNKPGLYSYNLARAWDSELHPNGSYRIDVEASDVHGNKARSNLTFDIHNGDL
jgi:Peptidase family M23